MVRAAAAAGLRTADLDDYRAERSAGSASVLGYGDLGDTDIPAAVDLLRDVLRSEGSWMDVERLAAAHVSRFNTCVAVGEFDSLAESFAVDGRLLFTGAEIGPFTGRDAIATAYREDPPDDTIELTGVQVTSPASVIATYTWTNDPLGVPGEMRMVWAPDGLLEVLEVALP